MADQALADGLRSDCCIVGGGPAGMVLGFLLARAGVDVVVLEKHKDFLRDFRGDTVHPSTLDVIRELGLLYEFLKRPHQELRELSGIIGGVPVRLADMSRVSAYCKFIALMPQWDFLDFLAERARRYPNFHLLMEAEVTDLLTDDEHVVGVAAFGREAARPVCIPAPHPGAPYRHRISSRACADLGAQALARRRHTIRPRMTLGFHVVYLVLFPADRANFRFREPSSATDVIAHWPGAPRSIAARISTLLFLNPLGGIR